MSRSASRTTLRRTVASGAALAAGAALLAGVTAPSAGAAAQPSAASAAVPAGLVPVRTLTSLLGTHAWYAQTFHGLPVVDGYYAVHTLTSGTSVADGRKAVPATLATTPALTAQTALGRAATARTAAAGAASAKAVAAGHPKNAPLAPAVVGDSRATLAVLGGPDAALVWQVVTTGDDGESRTLVDARTGAVREVRSLSKNAEGPTATPAGTDATGTASVFDPNPVVALRDESLTDGKDANSAVPNRAYVMVALPRLLPGSTTLSGRYAKVTKAAGGLARSAGHDFGYRRADDRFEQANAYYGIDKAQAYIQSLGFRDVNNEPQRLHVDTYKGDNSFYSPTQDTITYGTGGVDDAEDLEVVWHEYGHAIQDAQVPGYGSSEEAGATGEGFGDYWAVSMAQPTSGGFDDPCVMDWDSTSYTSTVPHCLRRTDTGKTVADMTGEVHDDGEIWSNALWDVHQALGRDEANRIVLEAQFSYTPDTSFAAAARVTVATARSLYGDPAARTVRQAFATRGIL